MDGWMYQVRNENKQRPLRKFLKESGKKSKMVSWKSVTSHADNRYFWRINTDEEQRRDGLILVNQSACNTRSTLFFWICDWADQHSRLLKHSRERFKS